VGVLEDCAITFLAGSIAGTNLVPLRWIHVWQWENVWFVYSIVSLTIVPPDSLFFSYLT
jgi:hypothetical protein